MPRIMSAVYFTNFISYYLIHFPYTVAPFLLSYPYPNTLKIGSYRTYDQFLALCVELMDERVFLALVSLIKSLFEKLRDRGDYGRL